MKRENEQTESVLTTLARYEQQVADLERDLTEAEDEIIYWKGEYQNLLDATLKKVRKLTGN